MSVDSTVPLPPAATHTPHDVATETADAVAVLETAHQKTEAILADAKRAMGMDVGDAAKVEPLRTLFKRYNVKAYPLVALSALIIVDQNQGYAFSLLSPEIADALGIGLGGISLLIGLKLGFVAIASMFVASLVQKKARRALVTIVGAIGWTVFTLGSGFVATIWGLLLVIMADGATSGATSAVHQPLLLDNYPPPSRMRILSAYISADNFGNVLSPVVVFGMTLAFDLTWRGIFLGLGLVSALGTITALRLRDPGFGHFDEDIINKAIADHDKDAATFKVSEEQVQLGFFEIVKRVFLIPTVKRLLWAFGVFGVFIIPLASVLSFFLVERYNLGPAQRAIFTAVSAVSAIISLTIYGRRGEEAFAKDPNKFISAVAVRLFLAIAALLVGTLMPNMVLFGVFQAASSAIVATLAPALGLAMFAVVPSRMRPHLAALMSIFLGIVGGIAGAVLLGSVSSRFGVGGAIVSMFFPALIGSLVLRSARKHLSEDIDNMIADQIEEQEVRALKARGMELPMLACRGINFSYGQLQVLFDIDFTVDDGEMVALLGTNGAGKSTLLRVISGTGLPQRGTVRYGGTDVTYLDAERRVALGITQVPGGRAVFGPLSVVDNLRLYGFAMGKSKRTIDQAMDEVFEVFPRLADRRNQMAQTLSGGEQQMLGVAKAVVLQPRLLLIDELSLGLAPIIVGQLMEMVREINKRGTAVVLVEQSVNVALELVNHAYFMEKGQIKFDGPAQDLLSRGDLLRAVFLEGADAQNKNPELESGR